MTRKILFAGLAALISEAVARPPRSSPSCEDRIAATATIAPKPTCEDLIAATATITPKLAAPFFKESKFSYHWSIVENEAGKLEDTIDGLIDGEDLLRIEHTSNCISTHQGEHAMDFCEAVATSDGATLEFSGGEPAYASTLRITLDSKLNYVCSFTATYPAETGSLKWKITKKELRLKSRELQPGSRILGWVSVAFDEIDPTNNRTKSYKIEGYFKPVLQHAKP